MRRNGLTLVEMLIAMAITLVMMGAVVNLFANISASVRDRRAMMELGSQLRSAREQLNRDLAGATCPAIPWQKPGEDVGYIEIIEGVRSDADPLNQTLDADLDDDTSDADIDLDAATLVPSSQLDPRDGMGLGDGDDVLALTVRSDKEPFVGRVRGGNTVESNLAEVIWFTVREFDEPEPGPDPAMRRVYRRALVIAPWVEPIDPTTLGQPIDMTQGLDYAYFQFYQRFDLSVHYDPSRNVFVPNTLGDLTKRENRYYRSDLPADFPFPMFSPVLAYPSEPPERRFEVAPTPLRNDRRGQDLMLNDALAFDVQVYDPGALLYQGAAGVFEPGDPGWLIEYQSSGATLASYGAFVDLGWGQVLASGSPYTPAAGAPSPQFIDGRQLVPVGSGSSVRGILMGSFPATYDTWSDHYEKDGIDQDEDNGIDEGTNGFDDDGANGVDDPGERETSPPYDVPLRAVQVKLRVYEREARQIREATVVRSFVP